MRRFDMTLNLCLSLSSLLVKRPQLFEALQPVFSPPFLFVWLLSSSELLTEPVFSSVLLFWLLLQHSS